MNDSRRIGRKELVGFLLTLAASTPAFSATYQVGLFEGATGTGSGSFEFTNNGSSGAASVTLSTNASSSIGAQTFNPASLTVQVAAVNFNDEKTTAEYGANQITGNYVEGLTGFLDTNTVPVASPATCATGNPNSPTYNCFYRITFAFTSNPNPNAALKTYKIELVRALGGSNVQVEATPIPSGTYSVSNTATIPEPGSLALLGIGFAALAWGVTRRRARGAAA